jgi:hypothetical protein
MDFTGGGGNGASGAAVARDGVGARETQGGFIYQRARVTTDDGGEASPCYGGSTVVRTAGAADGPGVRRAHGAVRRCGRRGSRCLGRSERRGAWASGSTRLRRRERQEGAWGHNRRGSAGAARRSGARRHDVLAPGLNCVAGSDFEFEILQIF